VSGRVGGQPAPDLVLELGGEALVLEHLRRAGQREQLMAPAQLPRDFGVAVVVEADDLDVLVEGGLPPVAALEVGVPVDLLAQLDPTRAQVVDAVGEQRLGLASDAPGRYAQGPGKSLGRRQQDVRRTELGEHRGPGDAPLVGTAEPAQPQAGVRAMAEVRAQAERVRPHPAHGGGRSPGGVAQAHAAAASLCARR
jgi:hypothetical protein